MNEPIQSTHAAILTRLAQMQQMGYYSTARADLAIAENAIRSLERDLAAVQEVHADDAFALNKICDVARGLRSDLAACQSENRIHADELDLLRKDVKALIGPVGALVTVIGADFSPLFDFLAKHPEMKPDPYLFLNDEEEPVTEQDHREAAEG